MSTRPVTLSPAAYACYGWYDRDSSKILNILGGIIIIIKACRMVTCLLMFLLKLYLTPYRHLFYSGFVFFFYQIINCIEYLLKHD